MDFLGVPLINGGSDRVFNGFYGVYGCRVGFLMSFLGVPLVNGGSDRGFAGF